MVVAAGDRGGGPGKAVTPKGKCSQPRGVRVLEQHGRGNGNKIWSLVHRNVPVLGSSFGVMSVVRQDDPIRGKEGHVVILVLF